MRTGAPSARDAVTGLPDEQFFWLRLREEHARARRYASPSPSPSRRQQPGGRLTAPTAKPAGDAALDHVARILESAKRGSDVAVRLSDDEFALLLLDCDKEGASAFATRLQQYLNGQPANVRLSKGGRPERFPLACPSASPP